MTDTFSQTRQADGPGLPSSLDAKHCIFPYAMMMLYVHAVVLIGIAAVSKGDLQCVTNVSHGLAIDHGATIASTTLSVSTSEECESKCCAASKCAAWTFTPAPRSDCPLGCCFLKEGSESDTQQHAVPNTPFTSGCVGFQCVSPSPSPGPDPLPFPYARPEYNNVTRVIGNASNGAPLRDPTTVIYDPVTSSWHVWCTYIDPSHHTTSGYDGVVWHFWLNSSNLFDDNVAWVDGGLALNVSSDPDRFDSGAVFTPSAIRDCQNNTHRHGVSVTSCQWYIFYGGINRDAKEHKENIGLAIADSPWGPFERWEGNPVFTAASGNMSWCDGTEKSLDFIYPTLIEGQRQVIVKSVCQNFTALPVVFVPSNGSSWAPPYQPQKLPGQKQVAPPLIQPQITCGHKGFEKMAVYEGPDGLFHLQGHNHGKCTSGVYSHFVSKTRDLRGEWQQASPFNCAPAQEPVPIPLTSDGIYGGSISSYWVDFRDFNINLINTSWAWNP